RLRATHRDGVRSTRRATARRGHYDDPPLLPRSQVADESAQRGLVAVAAKAAHDTNRGRRKNEVMTLRLTRVHVGQMHFDERHRYGGECIAQRDARMRVRARVDKRSVGDAAQLLDSGHQIAFTVGLKKIQCRANLTAYSRETVLDLGKRLAPVDTGLANTEHIEIRAVDDRDTQSTHCRVRRAERRTARYRTRPTDAVQHSRRSHPAWQLRKVRQAMTRAVPPSRLSRWAGAHRSARRTHEPSHGRTRAVQPPARRFSDVTPGHHAAPRADGRSRAPRPGGPGSDTAEPSSR